jgi:hypothetical protein
MALKKPPTTAEPATPLRKGLMSAEAPARSASRRLFLKGCSEHHLRRGAKSASRRPIYVVAESGVGGNFISDGIEYSNQEVTDLLRDTLG